MYMFYVNMKMTLCAHQLNWNPLFTMLWLSNLLSSKKKRTTELMAKLDLLRLELGWLNDIIKEIKLFELFMYTLFQTFCIK